MSKPREFWIREHNWNGDVETVWHKKPNESDDHTTYHVIEKSAYDKALKALCHVMIDFHADEKVGDDVHDYIYGVLEELGEGDQ